MSEELERKIEVWANQTPASHSSFEYYRLYDIVLQSYKENYKLSTETFEEALVSSGQLKDRREIKDVAEIYGGAYKHCFDMLEYMAEFGKTASREKN